MREEKYEKDSINLWGAVGLGTGVMIGATIFAVVGQVAELAGALFPLAYIGGAIVASFSSYAYIKMSNAYPSAGGIAMYFSKVYGKGTITASCSLLMAFSMIIAQSLVARTFGTYTLQLFDIGPESSLVPVLGVGLLVFTYIVNRSSNNFIQTFTSVISLIKITGLIVFALAALWATDFTVDGILTGRSPEYSALGLTASIALSLLSFKGFTTITNNGSEITNPKKNVGRAIAIAIGLCSVLYVLIAWAVSSSLTINEIVSARDYALAEAARPTLGIYGLWFTVGISILATITVCVAGVFAVSRMTAMLTNMELIPHSHFGMKGTVQKHMLVYIVALGIVLTVFFDLARIASLGGIYYILMDIIFQWGILKNRDEKVKAKSPVITVSLILNLLVFVSFIWIKVLTDPFIIVIALLSIPAIFIGEYFYTKDRKSKEH